MKKELSPKQREELLAALKARFEKNLNRHKGLDWAKVQAKLETNAEKLWSLNEMERTGGEPDVVSYDKKTGKYIFFDCSADINRGRNPARRLRVELSKFLQLEILFLRQKLNTHGCGHVRDAIFRFMFFPGIQRFTVVAETGAAFGAFR